MKLQWGGISSEEHDEAVMLEAAMFGGIPEGRQYPYAFAPHEFMQNRGIYPRPMPRPPSPSLTAQRLIREQQVWLEMWIVGCRRWPSLTAAIVSYIYLMQDDEYLASLQADREKELKAIEEAEAAREEEKRREEEAHRKLQEEQVIHL